MQKSSIIDIISPIMAGPSSSHTAGAVRLGLLAKNIYSQNFDRVKFTLYNSYAKTGLGHGTDKGLLAGVLGYRVDDKRIKNVFDLVKNIEYEFIFKENLNRHPNAVDFEFFGKENLKISGNSVGAGEIEITKIGNYSVNITGKYNTIIITHKDKPGMISEVTEIIQKDRVNIASLHCDRSAKGKEASMYITIDGDMPQKALTNIKNLKDIYIARYVEKIES